MINSLNRRLVAVAVFVGCGICCTVRGGDLECHKLAEGTAHQTMYFVQRAEEPGPTVLIVGGIHGNEPAGAHAVDVVRYWPITRGCVISVPQANMTALTANKRRIPDAAQEHSDLNRDFPKPDAELPRAPEHPLARALWELLKWRKPDWVFDCHEGINFHDLDAKSVGNSVIADKQAETQAVAQAMLETVNAGIEKVDQKFTLLGPPVAGSLARAASQHLGARALIVETTIKDQRLPVRTRQHRSMLHAALSKLNMLKSDVTAESLLTELGDENVIDVGIFDDEGVGGAGRERIEQQLAGKSHFRTVRFDARDLRVGACDRFEVLVFSGGTGSGQSRALGEEGRERVRRFVAKGGTYIGICAGAYLASSGSSSNLGLLGVQTKSPLWRRGRANLTVEITGDGSDLLGGDLLSDEDSRQCSILYANGPVWKFAEREDLPKPTVLGWYRSEVAENGTPEGIMVDSPAIVRAAHGSGTVYAFSCHPEQTAGCEDFVLRAISATHSTQLVGSEP
jgi:putative intracellular protease/amidase